MKQHFPIVFGLAEFKQRLRWRIEEGVWDYADQGDEDDLIESLYQSLYPWLTEEPSDVAHWEKKYREKGHVNT